MFGRRLARPWLAAMLVVLSVVGYASADSAKPKVSSIQETAEEAAARKTEEELNAQVRAAASAKDKTGFRRAFEEASWHLAKKSLGKDRTIHMVFTGPAEMGFEAIDLKDLPADVKKAMEDIGTQENEVCAASFGYAQATTRGHVDVTVIAACGSPTDINFSLTAWGSWLESNITEQLDSDSLNTRYSGWLWWPQEVGTMHYDGSATHSYKTLNIVRVYGANFSFFSTWSQWWANKRGDFYPRISAVGRPGHVPFPQIPYNPNRTHERDQAKFAAACKSWYEMNGWMYYTGDGWVNHHIKPLRGR